MLDPKLVRQQQEVDLMRSMGMFQDPLQQLGGLVNIINASQAPGIEQQRFEQDFGLRELLGKGNLEMGQAGQQDAAEHREWERGMGEEAATMGLLEFDLRQEDFKERKRLSEQGQQNQLLMGLLQLFSTGQPEMGWNTGGMQGFGQTLGQQFPGGFNFSSLLGQGQEEDPRLGRRNSLIPGTGRDLYNAAGMK